MPSEELAEFEIPGVGEIKARPGTSTAELAGAVSYWHSRWKMESEAPRKEGFISGAAIVGFAVLLGHAIYYLIAR